MRLGEWNLATTEDCSINNSTYCAPPVIDNPVLQTIVPDGYKRSSRNQFFDIALLRLKNEVNFSDFVRPICLPLDPSLWDKDFSGYTFDVAGQLIMIIQII